MSDDIQSRIVSMIPSSGLKEQIRLTGFRLSDEDQLAVVYQYAPDYDTRIEFLRKLEERFSGEMKAYASRLVSVQRQMLESFLRQEDGAVYELHIRVTPCSYDERYLCASYGDALKMIPLFYKEYDGEEDPSSRYTIDKRRILTEETGLCEDELGVLDLLPGMKILSVDVWAFGHKAEECGGGCGECGRPCAVRHKPLFPAFVKHGDAVKYFDYYSAEGSYGIALVQGDGPCGEYCIIPLDSDAVRYRDLADMYGYHEHIPAPLTERIEAKDLSEGVREDYQACLRYITENPSQDF